MFYIIGLGLGGAEDITVKGLEIVKRAERVYLEAYTSILTVSKEVLVRLCLRISGYVKCTVKMPNVWIVTHAMFPDTFVMAMRLLAEVLNFVVLHWIGLSGILSAVK